MTFGDPDAVINGSFTLDKKKENMVFYILICLRQSSPLLSFPVQEAF